MLDHIFILVNRFRTDVNCHCKNFIQIDSNLFFIQNFLTLIYELDKYLLVIFKLQRTQRYFFSFFK